MTKRKLDRTEMAGLVAERILKGYVNDNELASIFTEYCTGMEHSNSHPPTHEIAFANGDGTFSVEQGSVAPEGWTEQPKLVDEIHDHVTEFGGHVNVAWYQGEREQEGPLQPGDRFIIVTDNGAAYKPEWAEYMVWDYTFNPDIDYDDTAQRSPRWLRGAAVHDWSAAHQKAREMMNAPSLQASKTPSLPKTTLKLKSKRPFIDKLVQRRVFLCNPEKRKSFVSLSVNSTKQENNMPKLVPNTICLPARSGSRYSRDHSYDYHVRLDHLIACVQQGVSDEAMRNAGACDRDISTAREIAQLRS